MNVVDDVYAYLLALNLFNGTTGWMGLRRRIADQPASAQLVIIQEDGGGRSEQSASAGIGDSALSEPAVLVLVRAAAWDSDASLAKAVEIKKALHGLRNVQLQGGGPTYLGIRAATPEPIFAGFDDTGRPLHTISIRLMKLTAE